MTIVKTAFCNSCTNYVGVDTDSFKEWAEADIKSPSSKVNTGTIHICPTCQRKSNLRKDSE